MVMRASRPCTSVPVYQRVRVYHRTRRVPECTSVLIPENEPPTAARIIDSIVDPSKIESHTDSDLPLAVRSRRNKKRLTGRDVSGLCKVIEIDECRTVTEHRRVQDIVELNNRPEAPVLAELPLSRNTEIERVKAWASSYISR